MTNSKPFLHGFLMLGLLANLSLLAGVGCGGGPDKSHQWETFSVPREQLGDERSKLAKAVREVLTHRNYYVEREENMELPGARGRLSTAWNDEEARQYQGSYQGARYKVSVEIREGVEHLERAAKDPIVERYMNDREIQRRDTVVLSFGIQTLRDININMNYRPGDYERAEFKSDGEDGPTTQRLLSEIRRHYLSLNGQDSTRPEYGSARTRDIMRNGGQAPAEPEKPANSSGSRSYGPGDAPQSSGLDFGASSSQPKQ